jgi:hypothetical protein
MAKRGQHSFLKGQKERRRKEEAAEKMARRHGKAPDARDNRQGEHTAVSIDNEAATQ